MKRSVFSVFRSAKRGIVSRRVGPIAWVTIETTTYCNRRCSYCPNSIFERGLIKNKHLMAPALFRKIVDDLADIGFKGSLSPHGFGEPLTDSRLISFMHYAHTRLPDATLLLLTNGDFLTPTLLDKLYSAGVRNYGITAHSTDDRSLIGSVNRIMGLKKHAEDRNEAISLDYKVSDDLRLSNRGGLVKVDPPGPFLFCSGSDWPVAVNYRGDVTICCNDYLGQVVMGNLCSESLTDVWAKSEFVKLRRELARGVYKLEICKKCTRTASE
jgi:cyclic pyranopterin phosphate synthase